MQVLCTILGGDGDKVATCVTLRVIFIDSGCGMKRLMDVTNIVNQESEGI